ncbi:MAG: hypothetical protein ACON35_05055 [Candidatus Marinamargulisbacteria bacterium]
MIRLYSHILKKTFSILKLDPILFVPSIVFYMVLSFNPIAGFLNENVIIMGIAQWLIPLVLIQPFIMLSAAQLIKNRKLKFNQVFARLSQLLIPTFLITALHQPLYIFGAIKISLLNIDQLETIESLPNDQVSEIVVTVLIGLVIAVATTFVVPSIIDEKKKRQPLISQIIESIQLFLRFKWVALGVLITYFLTFFSLKIILLNLLLPILPQTLSMLFLHAITGMERAIYFVFIYRLFLYIKPMANLSDN